MQNKLYFIVLAVFVLGALIVVWFYLQNANETVPLMAPLVEINSNSAPIPSEIMSSAERLSVMNQYMSPRPYFFPNQYDQGADENASLIPEGNQHLLSVPFHTSQKVIRVYSNINCSVSLHESADCLGNSITLVKYDPETKKSEKITTITAMQAANSGGVFVPLALTPDDKNIILRAWMGSPGAGGGSVDLGYSEIANMASASGYSSIKLPHLASAQAIFYDSFGKLISLEESSKTADWSQPGRNPNQGAIMYRNLITGDNKTLADGANVTYDIRGFDENARTLSIQQIHYSFGIECQDSDKTLDCATATALNSTIRVP